MPRILIADSLGAAGIDALRDAGAEVDLLSDDDRPRLNEMISNYDALIVRSATQVDQDLLSAGSNLKVVGRAGVGVDNIDLGAATEAGVLVINAPTSNLLSAAEHTFALMLAVARKVSAADSAMKEGIWDRKTFVGQELLGKTLGVIGFGKIGQMVGSRARAFGMEIVACDPFLSEEVAKQHEAEPVELAELLERSDVVTFHTPLTDQTRGMLNAERIAGMKDGAIVVNCGRGGVLDEAAVLGRSRIRQARWRGARRLVEGAARGMGAGEAREGGSHTAPRGLDARSAGAGRRRYRPGGPCCDWRLASGFSAQPTLSCRRPAS